MADSQSLSTSLAPEVDRAIQQAVRAALRDLLPALAPRTGIGYDVHRFVEGRPLVLGGVEVPAEKGLHGHSDADAATHAIIDALLGAAALGDIGHFFPDTDPAIKGISSLEMLRQCRDRVRQEGYEVSSVDATIIAEKPRLAAHLPAMRQRIADTLDLPAARVSLKATTHEQIGSMGRGEGLAALACATIVPRLQP